VISAQEVHHAAPQCLLRLHAEIDGCIPAADISEAWLEFALECERWSVPVEISREDLERLVERSTEVLSREKHRLLHRSDFARWGARGGRETVRRYGSEHFRLLALHRNGDPEALPLLAARMARRREVAA
jgi:hypothetical protein